MVGRKGLPEHGQAAEHRFPTSFKIGSQPLDVLKLLQQLRNAAFARRCSFVGEACRHGTDLAGGKACRDQIADARRAAQVSLAIAAIAVFRAAGLHQAGLIVVAQHALRDPKPLGCFLNLHLDPFPHRLSTLTLVSRSSANFKEALLT